MAPLRAQIMHMTKTLHTTDREIHYFYGARALNEVFYLDDFLGLEKEYPNFHFHLALDRPDPAADAAGVKYTAGFVQQVMYNTYLKDHEAPEDIEYYMCGPGPMSKAVVSMLDSLGVEPESISCTTILADKISIYLFYWIKIIPDGSISRPVSI